MSEEPVTIYHYDAHKLVKVKGSIRYIPKDTENINEGNPLLLAVHNIHDNVEAARPFLDGGADVNLKDKGGTAALHYAAWKGNLNIAELLILNCANPSLKDSSRHNALHLAAEESKRRPSLSDQQKRVSLVKLLLDKQVDVNACNIAGATPLISAMMSEYVVLGVVKALLEAGADVNIPRHGGDTCLLIALSWDRQKLWRTDVIRELVKAGADIFFSNKDGQNAMDLIVHENKLQTPKQKCKLLTDVIKDAILKNYPKGMVFTNDLMETDQITEQFYREVAVLDSIRLVGETTLRDFALCGSNFWLVRDSVLDVLMRRTFGKYHRDIVNQFRRSDLREIIFQLGIYTVTGLVNTTFGNNTYYYKLFCQYLSKVDLINLIIALRKSPPAF